MQKDSVMGNPDDLKSGSAFKYHLALAGCRVRLKCGNEARIIGYGFRDVLALDADMVVLVRDVGGEKICYYAKDGTVVSSVMHKPVEDMVLIMDGYGKGCKMPVDLSPISGYGMTTRSGNKAKCLCGDMVGGKPYVVCVACGVEGNVVRDSHIIALYPDGTVYGKGDTVKDPYDVPLLGPEKVSMGVGGDMEKKSMIPFNIYAFRDGCKVIDSDGAEVEVLCVDRENNGEINIIGLDRNGQYLECDTNGESLGQPKRQVLFMDMDCYLPWLEEHRGLKRFDFDMAMDGHWLKTLKGDSARIIKVWVEEEKLTVLVYTKASHEDIREYDFEGRWLDDKSSVMEMLLVEENRVV